MKRRNAAGQIVGASAVRAAILRQDAAGAVEHGLVVVKISCIGGNVSAVQQIGLQRHAGTLQKLRRKSRSIGGKDAVAVRCTDVLHHDKDGQRLVYGESAAAQSVVRSVKANGWLAVDEARNPQRFVRRLRQVAGVTGLVGPRRDKIGTVLGNAKV